MKFSFDISWDICTRLDVDPSSTLIYILVEKNNSNWDIISTRKHLFGRGFIFLAKISISFKNF